MRKVKPLKKYIITSKFGEQRENYTHLGIDLATDYGANVYAAHSGKVHSIGENDSAGKYVILENSLTKTITKYYHLSNFVVKTGEKLTAGDLIGYAGSTGNSTGTHLHFEVLKNNKHIDPETFIKF
jgi:murein DD-endopeptidase MepM/ murein hydrolase activator NlpD